MLSRRTALSIILLAAGLAVVPLSPARGPDDRGAAALALDHKLLAEASGKEIMANLTYLCDEIGPRLTGSPQLRRANEWGARKMTEYGLVNVRQEAWLMPEGWERGTATGRIIEPNNGRSLTLASAGWSPGTGGKIEADVVAMDFLDTKQRTALHGKLKGKVLLPIPPFDLVPLADLDKPGGTVGTAVDFSALLRRRPLALLQIRTLFKELNDYIRSESVAAFFQDAGRHHGLLDMMGGWEGKDRPSATNRIPHLIVAHEHYELLYRLARRPAPAKTRIELEVTNKFVPGPAIVFNTVGEIMGKEKPDEVVVVGAHLDSWDLGQGATDNGTGSCVLLEAARILTKSGVKPRRTIRFILFTGEEQGLHGSRAYVEQHKDELPKISAAFVHDTGTGKVIGIDAGHRPALKPVFEKELVSLKELGVTETQTPFMGGSDHAPFDGAGVPGFSFRQEPAGYRLSHHSQSDTLERAVEPALVQGAQVMAVTAVRLANLGSLLPRQKSAK